VDKEVFYITETGDQRVRGRNAGAVAISREPPGERRGGRRRSLAALGGLEQMQLMHALRLGDLDRIVAGEAGIAEALAPLAEERVEPLPAQIAKRVRSE
jgi:hypothetical protein